MMIASEDVLSLGVGDLRGILEQDLLRVDDEIRETERREELREGRQRVSKRSIVFVVGLLDRPAGREHRDSHRRHPICSRFPPGASVNDCRRLPAAQGVSRRRPAGMRRAIESP
jgi:hypothetical protein